MKITIKQFQSLYAQGVRDFYGLDLSGLDLSGLDMAGADFSCSNMAGANLEGADFSCSNMAGAKLEGANLKSAYMRCANLEGTGLKWLDLPHRKAIAQPTEGGWLFYAGCFKGTAEELIARATYENKPHYIEWVKSII